jgi:hypothetical protein
MHLPACFFGDRDFKSSFQIGLDLTLRKGPQREHFTRTPQPEILEQHPCRVPRIR